MQDFLISRHPTRRTGTTTPALYAQRGLNGHSSVWPICTTIVISLPTPSLPRKAWVGAGNVTWTRTHAKQSLTPSTRPIGINSTWSITWRQLRTTHHGRKRLRYCSLGRFNFGNAGRWPWPVTSVAKWPVWPPPLRKHRLYAKNTERDAACSRHGYGGPGPQWASPPLTHIRRRSIIYASLHDAAHRF